MDFVPDGWLRSFSDAAELYDKLRLDERPTSGGEPEARILTLKKKQGDGQRLTDDEQKELTHLEDEYWLMQMLEYLGVPFGDQHRENKGKLILDARRWRQADSTKRLQQRLFDQDVRASIQDRNTGELHPLPGRFWASEQAEAMINGEKGLGRVGLALLRSVDYSVRIDAFRTALGPVRICREDVIRAARPATDPPANLTVERAPFIDTVSKAETHGVNLGNDINPLHVLIRKLADEINPGDAAPIMPAKAFHKQIADAVTVQRRQGVSVTTIKEALKGTRHQRPAKMKLL